MHRHPDHERIQAVIAGSLTAWRLLVADYAGLAFSVAHRHLRDHDESRNVVVDVFEGLHRGALARYDGQSAFSTWLVLLVRNAAVDHLRHEQGRRRVPMPILRRPDVDQRVFELFFMQGWPPEAVYARVRSEGARFELDAFWALITEMHGQLDERTHRRLRFDRQAHRLGHSSGRWLEYVDIHRQEADHQREEQRPDAALMAVEADAITARVRAEVALLSADEQRALTLRFQRSLSAREIADEMQLDDQRQAFTVIERAIRKLRRALVPRPEPLRVAGARVGLELES